MAKVILTIEDCEDGVKLTLESDPPIDMNDDADPWTDAQAAGIIAMNSIKDSANDPGGEVDTTDGLRDALLAQVARVRDEVIPMYPTRGPVVTSLRAIVYEATKALDDRNGEDMASLYEDLKGC